MACSAETPDVEEMFDTLSLVARAMTNETPDVSLLDRASFETAFDHLVIVQPAANPWRNRFDFVGSTVAEMSCSGDVTGMSFSDILSDSITPSVLNPYAHVARTRSAHVTRNFALTNGRSRFFTRYILPLFYRDKVALMMCAIVFHERSLGHGPAPAVRV